MNGMKNIIVSFLFSFKIESNFHMIITVWFWNKLMCCLSSMEIWTLKADIPDLN